MIEITIVAILCFACVFWCGIEFEKILNRRRRRGGLK